MSRKWLLIILLALLALPGCPVGAVLLEEQMTQRAQAFLEEGAYLEAIGTWRTLAELADNDAARATSLREIARIYEKYLREPKQALLEYQALINHFGDTPQAREAWFAAGFILHELGRFREARPYFLTYLRRYPDGPEREVAALLAETPAALPPGERDAPVRDCRQEKIRVLLDRGVPQVTLSAAKPLRVTNGEGQVLEEGLSQATIAPADSGLSLNRHLLAVPALTFDADGAPLEYQGRRWRGVIHVLAGAGGLMIVNELNLEEYLAGVVPQEMPPGWPLEALKAQAVAARTYALYVRERAGDRAYHLCRTVMSQVYGGQDRERETTSQAVTATRGRILSFQGAPALIYYHAHSGGMTEDPHRVWSSFLPYLHSLRDDFSLRAPDSSWQASVPLPGLRAALGRQGLNVGAITGVEPRERSPSGRVTRLAITHDEGVTLLSGNELRLMLDPRVIRSTLFDLTTGENGLTFSGRGFGHGVGMSQWGARIMADEGYSYREILSFYYPALTLD